MAARSFFEGLGFQNTDQPTSQRFFHDQANAYHSVEA
jgi:hypothetical protein